MLRVTTRNSPARMICSSTVGGCEHVPSSSVAMMARAAFTGRDYQPGPRLTIPGNPLKDGRPAAIWVSAVRADGKAFNPRAGFAVR